MENGIQPTQRVNQLYFFQLPRDNGMVKYNLESSLEAMHIVVVKINVARLEIRQESHLVRHKHQTAAVAAVRFEANLFSYRSRYSKVTEHQLLQGRTPHNVVWLDVSVHNSKQVHDHHAVLQPLLYFVWPINMSRVPWQTLFHTEFYTVAVAYEIEPVRCENLRRNSKH